MRRRHEDGLSSRRFPSPTDRRARAGPARSRRPRDRFRAGAPASRSTAAAGPGSSRRSCRADRTVLRLRIGTPVRPTLVRIRAAVAVRTARTAAHRRRPCRPAHRPRCRRRPSCRRPRSPRPVPAAPAARARRSRLPPSAPAIGSAVLAFERQPCARIKSPARDNRTSHERDGMGPRMNVGEAVARNDTGDSRPGPRRIRNHFDGGRYLVMAGDRLWWWGRAPRSPGWPSPASDLRTADGALHQHLAPLVSRRLRGRAAQYFRPTPPTKGCAEPTVWQPSRDARNLGGMTCAGLSFTVNGRCCTTCNRLSTSHCSSCMPGPSMPVRPRPADADEHPAGGRRRRGRPQRPVRAGRGRGGHAPLARLGVASMGHAVLDVSEYAARGVSQ